MWPPQAAGQQQPSHSSPWRADEDLAVTLTQAGGLLALNFHELWNGVGSIAMSENDRELLADHLILSKRKQIYAT